MRGNSILKLFILITTFITILSSIISCITIPQSEAKYLEKQEIIDLITYDQDSILDHLDSLVSTPNGVNNNVYFDEIDLWFFPYLVWDGDDKMYEIPLGSHHEPAGDVTWQQIEQANYHRVDVASEDCSHCLFPIGTWLVYLNGDVVAIEEQALSLETELT